MRENPTPSRLLRCYIAFFFAAWSLEAIYTLARLYTGYLSDAKTALPLGQLFSDGVVVLAVIRFAATVLALYLFVGLVAAWAHGKALQNLSDNRRRLVAVLFVLASMATMHWWNSVLHPYSMLSAHYLFSSPMAWPALLGAVAAQCVVAAILLLALVKTVAAHPRLAGAVPMVAGAALVAAASVGGAPTKSAAQPDKPNIILIGIDSLRADVLDASSNIAMPRLREFMSESVRFDNAFTPLARTFPAWVSILTGESPEQNGAIFNLMPPDAVASDRSLAHELRAHGYHTVLATDERRFSNIDESYGFDQIIGPRMGVADFLLGTANDFALSNLVLETPIGRYLFPYNYGNRAAAVTYDPDQFEHLLSTGLNRHPGKPLFLAAHFCLAHWPYHWRKNPASDNKDPDMPVSLENYRLALEAVDAQLGHLLDRLERTGVLNNALVIVLSDHGESFSTDSHGQIAYRPGGAEEPLRVPPGHGTFVLSEAQYRVVLGLRGYGDIQLGSSRRQAPVLLTDIKPTVLNLLKIDENPSTGTLTADTPDQNRILLWESGYSPSDITAISMQMDDLLADTLHLYRIAPAGRLSLKPQYLDDLKRRKQYAAYHRGWVAGAVPNDGDYELYFTEFQHDAKTYQAPTASTQKVLRQALCARLARDDQSNRKAVCGDDDQSSLARAPQ
ncbi:sulfatase-like hydrolase/transferase [Salinisphaera sp. P385]|uniref:Sulfatase-like hydrolase/transferase n=1 Tax=Spectribacter acetivorans TaxID=3075603 RepID=A0ABU3BBF1_9GAMM|nr:sulfatase-like hydrolase/transferase [Salinisphaera sp. P385]MDT0619793.1 sulfatase-like hydrolase/transferase [Salinisphaera sp. P385]